MRAFFGLIASLILRCRPVAPGALAVSLLGSVALVPELAGQSLSPPAQTVLHVLNKSTDGASPNGPLLLTADGFFYGTNRSGGAGNQGTIFRLGAAGTGFTVLRSLGINEGSAPGALILGADGRLFGTAVSGGFRGVGTVFSLKRDGTDFTVLHTFNSGPNGGGPSPLLEGAGGRLYGVTRTGGSNGVGTIFSIQKDGSEFTVLRHLAAAEGSFASAGLIQGGDGKLYGATSAGGAGGRGTIFAINADGTGFSVLRSLSTADGYEVSQRLLLAGGRLYGTAGFGGASHYGTVFRLGTDGSDFAVLKAFNGFADGSNPKAGLIPGPNGLLLGITYGSGTDSNGTLFRIRIADGTFALLANLGQQTLLHTETLTLGNDQKVYGVASAANASVDGAIFSFALTPSFTSAATASATVGRFFLSGVTAVGAAGNYVATGLPTGLTIDPAEGTISGTPLQAGTFAVTVGATNEIGTGTAVLTLSVAKGPAAVTLSNLTQGYDGRAKPVTVVTTPAGLSTATTYNGSATVPTDPGLYEVRTTITDPSFVGSATANLSINMAGPTVSAISAPAVVLAGVSAKLSVVAGGSPAFTYRWQRSAGGGSAFVDVSDGAEFSGVASAVLTVWSPTLAMNGEQFRCIVTNPQGSVTGAALTLSVLPGSRLANISIRASVAASQPIVVGFVTNAGARRVLIRAIGPGLAPFLGSSAGLADDPSLTLFGSAGAQVGANDNWAGAAALSAAFATAGAFALPPASLDAALLAEVNGAYTAQMKTTATGLGLVEVYDTSTDSALRTVNFSTLYRVGTGADALVAGFVIAGTGAKTLLVRGIGPALRAFGVGDVLADPKLELFDATGARVATNDDWTPGLAPTFTEVGAFALTAGSKDAAFVVTVPPGLYSVQLATGDGVSGQGLIEVYELPR